MRAALLILLLALPATLAQNHQTATQSTQTRMRTVTKRQALDQQIAVRFAPVIYQGLGEQPRADYLTSFDFDGDWKGDNNWNNLNNKSDNKSFPLRAWLYYSVIETTTHYFIHYAVFHPRDYKGGLAKSTLVETLINEGLRRAGKDPTGGLAEDVALSHENDLEGCLVVVEKKGDDLSKAAVQYLETIAHNRFIKYHAASVTSSYGETLELKDNHPQLFAEPKGHGLSRYTALRDQLKKSVNGVLTYEYAGRADDPEKIGGKNIGYDLVPIYDTLWQHAQAGENETYGEATDFQSFRIQRLNPDGKTETGAREVGTLGAAFRGNVGFKNKARPPWSWFDEGEKDRPKGEWFFDPAGVIARHFNLSESFSSTYVYHQYFKIGL